MRVEALPRTRRAVGRPRPGSCLTGAAPLPLGLREDTPIIIGP